MNHNTFLIFPFFVTYLDLGLIQTRFCLSRYGFNWLFFRRFFRMLRLMLPRSQPVTIILFVFLLGLVIAGTKLVTVNVDMFVCIHFREFVKIVNFAWI